MSAATLEFSLLRLVGFFIQIPPRTAEFSFRQNSSFAQDKIPMSASVEEGSHCSFMSLFSNKVPAEIRGTHSPPRVDCSRGMQTESESQESTPTSALVDVGSHSFKFCSFLILPLLANLLLILFKGALDACFSTPSTLWSVTRVAPSVLGDDKVLSRSSPKFVPDTMGCAWTKSASAVEKRMMSLSKR